MKRSGLIIIGMICVAISSSAQQQWTLQQCLDSALANNRNVKQQNLVKKQREIAYQQSRQSLLPNLNASVGQNWNFGRSIAVDNTYKNINQTNTSFGISSSLLLFDGLRMKYNIEARMAEKNVSEAELEKIKQDIQTTVSASFLQVLLNKELLVNAKEQLEVTKVKIEQRKAFVESGKMAEGEVLELIAQQSTEEMNQLKAENNLKLSLLDLAQIMEIENFERLDIVAPDNLSETDLNLLTAESVYESALGHRPEIKSAEYRLKSSEYGVKSAKSNYFPTLSMGAQIGTGYYNMHGVPSNNFGKQINDNMSSGIGLSLQIPIFNKFEIRNNVQSAQIAVESSKLEISNAKIELKKAIQQAYFNALGAKSRWEAAQKSELSSREAYRFTNQKYEAGKATTYELYQAKNNLSKVISEEAQAKYEYFFRVKLLELYK